MLANGSMERGTWKSWMMMRKWALSRHRGGSSFARGFGSQSMTGAAAPPEHKALAEDADILVTPVAAVLRQFLREFAAFAGRTGIFAVLLVALGAMLEGFSLVLIVPLLAIMIE